MSTRFSEPFDSFIKKIRLKNSDSGILSRTTADWNIDRQIKCNIVQCQHYPENKNINKLQRNYKIILLTSLYPYDKNHVIKRNIRTLSNSIQVNDLYLCNSANRTLLFSASFSVWCEVWNARVHISRSSTSRRTFRVLHWRAAFITAALGLGTCSFILWTFKFNSSLV